MNVLHRARAQFGLFPAVLPVALTISPTQEIPLSLRFVLERPKNYRHANSERFQKMLEAPSTPEIKGELHNILSKPEEAGGETHRGGDAAP